MVRFSISDLDLYRFDNILTFGYNLPVYIFARIIGNILSIYVFNNNIRKPEDKYGELIISKVSHKSL
jgi:hypothetical protein